MRITEPTTNPLTLVDRQGIAARLEVALSTVDKWKIRRLLPAPDFPGLANPVWFWETIRQWADETGRMP